MSTSICDLTLQTMEIGERNFCRAIVFVIAVFGFTNDPCNAQNGLLEIHGLIVDDTLKSPLALKSVTVWCQGERRLQLNSNVDGEIEFNLDLPNDVDTLTLRFEVDDFVESEFQIPSASKFQHLELDINMAPTLVCTDYFYPRAIHFKHGTCELQEMDSIMFGLWEINENEVLKQLFERGIFNITSYASFDEDASIAALRADFAKQLLVRSGVVANHIHVVVKGHEDLLLSLYDEGCHPYYFSNVQLDLSLESISSQLSKEKRMRMNEQRCVVLIRYIRPE
ncbi:MAG: hypothetical protein KDC12_05430 [Flavobacteriales bacterium]|nr:hypothetical protein [Flavobacteriales bacterium]